MTKPPRITIWHPVGPEGEALANLIKGVLPEADVHLGPLPTPLKMPPSDTSWIKFTESRRERRKRLGLRWWQREKHGGVEERNGLLLFPPGSTSKGGSTS
jgi:hypothetical protein